MIKILNHEFKTSYSVKSTIDALRRRQYSNRAPLSDYEQQLFKECVKWFSNKQYEDEKI